MRGLSAAHDKAEDHKSERAFTREQQFEYAFELELLQSHMAQKPVLRGEVGLLLSRLASRFTKLLAD